MHKTRLSIHTINTIRKLFHSYLGFGVNVTNHYTMCYTTKSSIGY